MKRGVILYVTGGQEELFSGDALRARKPTAALGRSKRPGGDFGR
jgi:hypothetical protein